MPTVSIEKVRELKKKAEKDINETLQSFTDKAGVEIKSLIVYNGHLPVPGKGVIKTTNIFIET